MTRSTSRTVRTVLTGTTLAVVAALAAGCGGTSTGTKAAAASGRYASGKSVILDTLYRAPLAQAQAAGAKQAASEAGAEITWVGPPDVNPTAAIKALQDAAATGGDGAVVAAFPGDLFRVPINQTGLPLVTVDIYSPGSKQATHFGPDKYALGVAMAQEFAKALPQGATGTIVGGICVPGLPSLQQPQAGFADTIKELAPGITVKGDVPVDPDPTKNYASWQRIIQQNPTALGFIGQCDQDAPNLIKLKRDSGAEWLAGDTSGDDAATIAAVKDGTLVTIISQNGWVEGYLSAKMLLQHIALKKALPQGWIDTGLTAITPQNADQVTARLSDPALNATDFSSLVDRALADPQAAMKPYTDCRGCGTKS